MQNSVFNQEKNSKVNGYITELLVFILLHSVLEIILMDLEMSSWVSSKTLN